MKVEGENTPIFIVLPADLVQHISQGNQDQQIPTVDTMTYLFCQGFMGLKLDEEKGERLYLDIGDVRSTFKFPQRLREGDMQVYGPFGKGDAQPIVSPSSYVDVVLLIENEQMDELTRIAQRVHTTIEGLFAESVHTGLFIYNILNLVISQNSNPVRLVAFKDGKEEVYPIQPQA